jgi:hypothetical protein
MWITHCKALTQQKGDKVQELPSLSYLMRAEVSPSVWIYVNCMGIGNFNITLDIVEGPPPMELGISDRIRCIAATVILHSQMRTCIKKDDVFLVNEKDMEAIAECRTILASMLDYPPDVNIISRSSYLPPPEHGTAALFDDKLYYIADLPRHAQDRQKQISKMLADIPAAPIEAGEYFEYPECPQELREMIRQLAQDYHQYHMTVHPHARTLTPITSGHVQKLPSSNEARALIQSFSPSLLRKPTLWDHIESPDGENSEIHLVTPNNSHLNVRGETEQERKALHTYITKMIGTEGLKHMLVMLSIYMEQTGGRDRKEDACVKLRDVLKRIYNGDEKHIDDPDEQRKLMHSILYLARTWVTDMSKPPEESRNKKHKYRDYTPLLVLERLRSDEITGIRIPQEIEFHLGEDFYNLMFGRRQKFWTLPTSLILSYHSVQDQHEICLAFHLGNMVSLARTGFREHFPALLVQAGLMSMDEITHGHDRTRDALSVLYALEHIDRDGIVRRGEHEDIDTILATEYFLHDSEPAENYNAYVGKLIATKKQKRIVSVETYHRIHTQYFFLRGKTEQELRRLRLSKLKHLLATNERNTIPFSAGITIGQQVEKYKEVTKEAIEKSERAKIAAMSKGKKRGRKPKQES